MIDKHHNKPKSRFRKYLINSNIPSLRAQRSNLKRDCFAALAMTLLSNSGNSYIKISKSGFGTNLKFAKGNIN